MPELPEVETIRQDLRQRILNKKITDVQIIHSKTVKNDDKVFVDILKNNQIKEIDRIGKLIILELKDGKNYLLVHLKMTGQLIYQKGKDLSVGGHSDEVFDLNYPNKHTRVIITFVDKSNLFFNDLRIFGYMHIVDEKEKQMIKSKFGIEPLTASFTLEAFTNLVKNKKTNLKALLLNQQMIAGLGNIYVDETCFEAGIMPTKSAGKLKPDEINKLYSSIQKILKKAVENRGTTFNNYVDSDGKKGNFVKHLQIYGRGGEPCKKCKTVLVKQKLVGRGTVYCIQCQK